MASIPSDKLRIDFGWMLNRVADCLSKVDCNKIALAEQLPKSMIDPESDVFQVTLLHTLEGRGKFGPLNPDGLIEILKKLQRMDAISEVDQYKSEQRYKNERELHKRRKRELRKKGKQDDCTKNAVTEPEVERLVAEAKSRTFAHIQSKLRELDVCVRKADRYSRGEVGIVEVRESFMRFYETIETNEGKYRTSSMSSSSTSTSEGSSCTDDASKCLQY